MKKLLLGILLICGALPALSQQESPSHESFSQLLKKHVSARGLVDYRGFIKDSVKLNAYLLLLSRTPPRKTWSRDEQMAFWINAYNAFTIKLITEHYPLKSIKDIGSSIQIPFVNTPWDIKFITIGKSRYDLNNIEHGILRKKFDEPRVHMVLVCASKSCPALQNEAYDPARLDAQLTKQTRAFLDDPSRNELSAKSPKLSMIFNWYAMDFNKDGKSVRDFINGYATVKIQDDATVSYMDYDWSLNE